MRYKIFDFLVETDIVLGIPEAREQGQSPDFTFQLVQAEIHDTVSCPPYQTYYVIDDDPWLTCSRSDFGYKLHYVDLGICWISLDGAQIRCYPHPGTPQNTLAHLVLDQTLPLSVSHRGETVLHASAVIVNGSAAVFVGDSGNGKSTLTTSFCAAGFPLLADDGLLLRLDQQHIWGIGSYPGLRLWSDSAAAVVPTTHSLELVSHYSEKRRITPASMPITFCDQPVPVSKIYLLADPQMTPPDVTISFEKLSPSASAMALLEHSFRLDTTDKERNGTEFERLTALAARVPVYRLNYPRAYDLLPRVREAILSHLQSGLAPVS